MTLPSLSTYWKGKAYVTQLKKELNTVEQVRQWHLANENYWTPVFYRIEADGKWICQDKEISNYFKQYRKITIDSTDTKRTIYSSFNKQNVGKAIVQSPNKTSYMWREYSGMYHFVTEQGVTYYFTGNWQVVIDLDGPYNGENTLGRDVFMFGLDGKGRLVPYKNIYGASSSDEAECQTKGESCAYWALKYGDERYYRRR